MATNFLDIGLGGTVSFGGDWGDVTLTVDPETGQVSGSGEGLGGSFQVSSQSAQDPNMKYLLLGLGAVVLILLVK